MTKIIVVSDTHGGVAALEKLRPLIEENDLLIYLGDGLSDLRPLTKDFSEKIYAVRGNCDFFSTVPASGELDVEWIKIFYCHGHEYGVKSDLSRLAAAAKSRGAQIAFYGHTHRAAVDEVDGVTLINPGSLKRPVGEGGSYAYLVVNKDKFTHVTVGESVF